MNEKDEEKDENSGTEDEAPEGEVEKPAPLAWGKGFWSAVFWN